MRKEYGKALRDEFAARMAADFPAWRPAPAPRGWYWPGERVYVREDHATAWLVVVLQGNAQGHDAFEVEIGWSRRRRVPELSLRPCMEDPHGDAALERDEFLCRLSSLVPGRAKLHGSVEGWLIDPRTYATDPDLVLSALVDRQTRRTAGEARTTVTPFVDEALEALAQVGVPYLESRLALL